MNDLDTSAFSALFKEAYGKCFGHPMTNPLTETESKLFANKILDQTGLVIGPKSIKNYSLFVLNGAAEGKEENPSVATLDTLARYAGDAPYTDEVKRKVRENHYPYWFQYKNKFYRSQKKPARRKRLMPALIIFSVIVISIVSVIVTSSRSVPPKPFTDDFNSVADDTLSAHGWFIKSKDERYWNRRSNKPGYLTLYTLRGDNWPDSLNKPGIKNLLLRKISADCFTVEIHLSEFIPQQNWQQAGIILLEDTNFSKKSLRLSFLYNDFYGGFPNKKDIVIQAITSQGKNDKPEEIIHQVVFTLDSANENLVKQNLRHAALRIERRGKKFRLLFANGGFANTAFKELTSQDIDVNPQYIGLFAIKGFVDNAPAIPALFDYFNYSPVKCE